MRLQNDGLFYQSEQYVSFLCEPLNILQFLGDQANQSMNQSTKLDYLEILNKSNKQENSHKTSKVIKQNPYGSEWANQVLQKQFGIYLSNITQRKRPKWIIKKLKMPENKEEKNNQYSTLINDIKFQDKLNRQTASKSNNRRLNKLNKDYQQSFSGQRQSFSGQRQSFSGQQQPLTSFEQQNL